MSHQANPTVVGGFVIGALALVLAGVLVFGSGMILVDRVPVVAFFSGNVRGLQEGSAVEFRGVRVGTVKRIQLLLLNNSTEPLIPVYMELETRSLALVDSASKADSSDALPFLEQLVAQGLRARLDLKSFVTGQLAVNFDMHPGTEITRIGAIEDVYELPTLPSTLDRVFEVLQDLPLQDIAIKLIDTLDKVEKVLSDKHLAAALSDAAGVAAEARQLMQQLQTKVGPALDKVRATMDETRAAVTGITQHANSTLDDYAELARGANAKVTTLSARLEKTLRELGGIRAMLDARIAPVSNSAVNALGEARGAMANARILLAEDSRTQHNLNITLEELAAAARSLRIMADYLEQHPDALIKGK